MTKWKKVLCDAFCHFEINQTKEQNASQKLFLLS